MSGFAFSNAANIGLVFEVEVMLQLTASRSVDQSILVSGTHFGTHDQIFIATGQLRVP
jgi:tRNA threonylcarbamoyladenosine modification (KEOPS) complex Cgi121 subunit